MTIPPDNPDAENLPRSAADTKDPFGRLAQLLEAETFDLADAALTIAAAHYPGLPIDSYLARLDAYAAQARARLGRRPSKRRSLTVLNTLLFEELGFRGNKTDYYDPANSLFNEVLDRRLGIPITLSILYMAVAERLGLPVVGVGMPMHFLVKYVDTRQEILLDPFHGGQTLTPEDCRARLETIAGRPVPLLPHYFQETPKRQILYRMLNNLKQIYLARQESQRAGRVIEQMWLVNPGDPEALRDRGQLYLQEQAFSSAMAWLSAYLERAPDAPDAGQVQQLIAQAAEQRALRN